MFKLVFDNILKATVAYVLNSYESEAFRTSFCYSFSSNRDLIFNTPNWLSFSVGRQVTCCPFTPWLLQEASAISYFPMGASWSSASPFDMDQLPEEVLYEILLRVPNEDLMANCRLVCKHWKEFIDGHSLWKEKAKRRGCVIPKSLNAREVLPKHVYRNIALRNPFGRNLVRNPYGKDSFVGWSSCRGVHHRSSHFNGWAVEDPPNGADNLDTVPELNGHSTCFATTYYPCSKQQLIDLYKEGCSADMMTELTPAIHVCEWYAARFDCGSVYRLRVELEDCEKRVVDRFAFEHIEPQWTGSRWTKVQHTFPKHLDKVRYVKFHHEGQDTQFWAGNYGSKMTGATVKLIL